MNSTRRVLNYVLMLGVMWGFNLADASAQVLPRELWEDFSLLGELRSHTETLSEVDASIRIRDARARFQSGDMQRVDEQLRGKARTFDENDLVRFAKCDEREAALVRAIGAFLDRKDFDAYFHANEVHRLQPNFENPDVRDREACLVKSLVLMRAGVIAWSYLFAGVDEPRDNPLPLSASLRKELGKHGKFVTEPIMDRKAHPKSKGVWVRAFGIEVDPIKPAEVSNVVLTTETGMFLGALVVVKKSDHAERSTEYRLTFNDLDRQPLVLAEYGSQPPSVGDLLKITDSLAPRLGSTQDRGDFPMTPLRAEVEALYWHREQIAPLAMWWVKRAGENSHLQEAVVAPLRASRHDQWRPSQPVDSLRDNVGRLRLKFIGFVNERVPSGAEYGKSREPWEHFQIVIVDSNGKFRTSCALTSKYVALPDLPGGGGRLYLIKQRSAHGVDEVPCLLDGDPPSFDKFADEIGQQVKDLLAEQKQGD